ncbi:hypothetical protein PROFUN_02317 [Planoprotostelium fungivorum]|uniref:HTTM-like domain-containing protein n=1 Tax=Planoprotostelium fungivorum TaxID=1890364 RepID=A0A2P6NYM8_9EUKA|nr:hypothetical protein PROFUN_02317 [Planoprotostelium fungivorum]
MIRDRFTRHATDILTFLSSGREGNSSSSLKDSLRWRNYLDIWSGESEQSTMDRLVTLFGIDYRSLAFFRVMMSLVLITDTLQRWYGPFHSSPEPSFRSDVYGHYSDLGIHGRAIATEHFVNENWIIPHMTFGSVWGVSLLFAIQVISAFLMGIGYHTKLNATISYFLNVSVQARNWMVLHGGDVYIRVILLMSIFLPIDKASGIDNSVLYRRHDKPRKQMFQRSSLSHYFVNVASVSMLFQISFVYWTSWVDKTGDDWNKTGDSTWLALNLSFFTTALGEFMSHMPRALLQTMTFSVLWWEGYGPLFFVSPVYTSQLRALAVFGYVLLHVGFATSLRLGIFGSIGMTAPMLLMPSWFWERLIFSRLRTRQRLNFTFQFNPYSKVATFVAAILQSFFLLPESQVKPMQKIKGIPLPSFLPETGQDISSEEGEQGTVSLYPTLFFTARDYEGRVWNNQSALAAAFDASPLLYPFSFIWRTTGIRHVLHIFFWLAIAIEEPLQDISEPPPLPHYYGSVKKETWNRHTAFRRNFLWGYKKGKKIALNGVALVFFVIILQANMYNANFYNWAPEGYMRYLMYQTHLQQQWKMFSPNPPRTDWYFILEGKLVNGTDVELFGNEGLFTTTYRPYDDLEQPKPYRNYKNHRWFKYLENGVCYSDKNEVLRLHWGRFICREYNAKFEYLESLSTFSIKRKWISLHPETDERVQTPNFEVLWNHRCRG